jgi:hypothetical protein
MDFPILQNAPPHVDTRQMIEVDRLMVEGYHIDHVQMMENTGRNLARLAVSRLLQNGAEEINAPRLAMVSVLPSAVIATLRVMYGKFVMVYSKKDSKPRLEQDN